MSYRKEGYPTQHVVGHVDLDVPFAVEHHLTFDTLVCLLLLKQRDECHQILLTMCSFFETVAIFHPYWVFMRK